MKEYTIWKVDVSKIEQAKQKEIDNREPSSTFDKHFQRAYFKYQVSGLYVLC